MNSPWSK